MNMLTLGDLYSKALKAGAEGMREGARRLTAQGDQEGIHLIRTSARRLRATLKYLGGHLGAEPRSRLARGLRGAMSLLSPARDLDVLLQAVKSAPGLEPQHSQELLRRLGRPLERALAKAREFLEGESWPVLLGDLEAAGSDPGSGRPAALAGPARISGALERVLLQRPESWAEAPDESLHELRKSTKRLRYALEAFRPAFGEPLEEMIEAARDLQDALGAVQDVAMFGKRLGRIDTFGSGAFLTALRTRALEERSRLPKLWRRAFRGKSLGRLGAHLLRRAVKPPAPADPPLVAVPDGEARVAG